MLLQQEHCKQRVDTTGRVTTTESQQPITGSHQSDYSVSSTSSVSLTSLSQRPLSDGNHVYLYLQNTTLSWHGSVCSHQHGRYAALVCSQKVRRVHDTTQRKPIPFTCNTGLTPCWTEIVMLLLCMKF